MLIRVRNAGQIGIIRDTRPIELPPNAWSDGNNMICREGAMESRKGIKAAIPFLTPSADYIMAFETDDQTIDWIFAADQNLYTFSRNASVDADVADRTRSSPAQYTAGFRWFGTLLTSVPVLGKPNITPQFLSEGASEFEDLRNWPSGMTAKGLIAYKNFLVAYNIDEGSGPIRNLVRWSNPADPRTIPDSWDYTDPNNRAGRAQIGDSSDAIVTARILHDSVYLYRRRTVWRMTFIGGNEVFRFEQVFGASGIAGRYALGSDDNRHYYLSEDIDLLVNDGVTTQSMIDGRMRDYLRNILFKGKIEGTFVYHDPIRSEIICGFPTADYEGANQAVVIDARTGQSSLREMNSATYADYGKFSYSEQAESPNWYSLTGDTGKVVENRSLYSARSHIILDDINYFDDNDVTGSLDYSTHLVREDLPLTQYGIPQEKVVEVKTVYPHITVQGDAEVVAADTLEIFNDYINIYIITKDSLSDRITDTGVLNGPYRFIPGTDYKVDVRESGRYIGIVFENPTNAGLQWKITGYDIELDVSGER